MKTPKFLTKLAAKLSPRPKRRYQATARAARTAPAMDDYDEEPTTKLSSAFVVVLILHVVAVGGIYAFNSIKASRRSLEQVQAAAAPAAVETTEKTTGSEADNAPANVSTPAAALTVTHPAAATHPVESVTPVSAPAATAKPTALKQYVVKAGDSAAKIAFAYRITPAELLAANSLKENAVLHHGQTLTIPEPKTDAKSKGDAAKPTAAATSKADVPPTKTTPGLYSVKKGDTAHSIAKTFGITVDELLKLNKITDPTKLQIGKQLKLPPHKS